MKTLRFVITLACALMLSAALFATGVNTSWITFTQPDGTTFMGRTVGDEFESFSETQDGYRFVRNYENKYYYYAVLANPGDYTPSRFRVGIDKPEGIPRHLERTAERKRVLAAKRARFERELDVVRADTRAMAASVTFTLKVLLVEFQDVKHRNPSQDGKPAYTFQNFEDLFFSSGTYTSSSPDGEQVFGSMRDYYTQMSAGNFTLSGNVLNRDDDSDNVPDWLVLDYNKSAYTGSRNVRTDALNKASAAGLNTSTNSTTKLVVVYAGNIWLAGSLWPSAGSTQYVMCERFHWNDRGTDPTDAPFSHIGIHAHEFGHLLGFTDLYTSGNDHKWSLMNVGNYNGPSGIGGRTGSAPAPLNPEFRRQLGVSTLPISGSPQTTQADYSLQNPEIFQIDDPHTSFYWLIENRHFQDNDLNSYLPSAFPNYVNGQGLLVWRMDALDDDFPELIPADNDFHQVPNGTASQGDHGDFFPGANNNLLFAPTTIPSSAPSDDDVAFEVKSDNGTSFTVDFYNSNAPNPPPDAPKNLVITNVGQNGENPVLQWDANTEPDLDNYNIYRGYNDLETGQIIWNSVATATNTTWTDYDVTINTASQTTFRYKITAVDNASNESDYSNTVSRKGTWVPKQAVESSEDQAQNLPKQITLHQNYPNPFNPETEIRFELPEDARVVLNIYNILGEEVRSPVSGNMEMGFHSVSRDGKDKTGNDLPSGIYIYRFSVKPSNIAGKPFTAVKKLTLLR